MFKLYNIPFGFIVDIVVNISHPLLPLIIVVVLEIFPTLVFEFPIKNCYPISRRWSKLISAISLLIFIEDFYQ